MRNGVPSLLESMTEINGYDLITVKKTLNQTMLNNLQIMKLYGTNYYLTYPGKCGFST